MVISNPDEPIVVIVPQQVPPALWNAVAAYASSLVDDDNRVFGSRLLFSVRARAVEVAQQAVDEFVVAYAAAVNANDKQEVRRLLGRFGVRDPRGLPELN